MTSDEQIDLLDAARDRFFEQDKDEPGVLRISRGMFRLCTKGTWNAHGWQPSPTELFGLKSTHDGRLEESLYSLLRPELVSEVEFVDEPDILEFYIPENELD